MRLVHEMELPVIGITTNAVQDGNRPWDQTKLYAQAFNYSNAIHQAGGTTLLIPQMEDPSSIVSHDVLDGASRVLDGILLAGGSDINPGLYGEVPHPETEQWSNARDETEMRLLDIAESKNIPILAICRGMQIWNVNNGGSLHQHIPDLGLSFDHANHNKELENRLHKVTIEKTSALGNILLPGMVELDIDVDSHHHQAIKKLGRDLRVVAWSEGNSEGNIAEAIETTNEEWFALGVQWHPESMEEAFRKLFKTFVDAARPMPIKMNLAA